MEDILTPDEKNTAQRVKKTIDKYAISLPCQKGPNECILILFVQVGTRRITA